MYRIFAKLPSSITGKMTIDVTYQCRTISLFSEAINDILYYYKGIIIGIDKAQYVGPALPDGGGKAYQYVPIEEWKNNEQK